MLRNSNNKQRGIGLLELMLSLSIIAILLVMATRYFIITSRSEQVNRATTQIGALQGAISNWKGGQPDYTNLTFAALYQIGMLSIADYVNTSFYSPWGTPVFLSNLGPSYTLNYNEIPGWACISLYQKYGGINNPNVACTSTDPSTPGNFTVTYPEQ